MLFTLNLEDRKNPGAPWLPCGLTLDKRSALGQLHCRQRKNAVGHLRILKFEFSRRNVYRV